MRLEKPTHYRKAPSITISNSGRRTLEKRMGVLPQRGIRLVWMQAPRQGVLMLPRQVYIDAP
jgi:hypothetical protein